MSDQDIHSQRLLVLDFVMAILYAGRARGCNISRLQFSLLQTGEETNCTPRPNAKPSPRF